MVIPMLPRIQDGGAYAAIGELAVEVCWQDERGGAIIRLAANLKDTPEAGFTPSVGECFWQEGKVDGDRFEPWSVRWTIEKASA